MTEPAIETRDLTKKYGRIRALDRLTMSVPRGEVFGFLGPNGAGKTTAVKLLVGLARPTAGQAWILGVPAGDRRTRKRVGYLPELFRYQGWLTAYEVLKLHCELAGLARERWPDEIDHALVTVGLASRAHGRVDTFSKGMQQRLGLGVALLGRPEVLLLDEPTSALDPGGRHDVREIIRALKTTGTTVFLNSHLLSEVELVCERVAVVDHGHVVASGLVSELLGAATAIRVHASGLNGNESAFERFGNLETRGEWLTFHGLADDRIPDVVAEVVRLGGRVYAVEHHHDTLEDRFLELLREDPE